MTNAERHLDFILWKAADNGQRFYPPKETAWDCFEAYIPNYEERFDDPLLTFKLFLAYHWELGQHSRSVLDAMNRIEQAEKINLNPIERIARRHREMMKEGMVNEPLDWTWYHA